MTPIILFAALSGCANLADSILTEDRVRAFATKALEVVGPAVEEALGARLQEEADRRTQEDRDNLIAAGAKRGVDWRQHDYNGDGTINVGHEYLDLVQAVERAAEESGMPLTPGETGGAVTTFIALAAVWLESRKRKRFSRDAEGANVEADVVVRGVKSLRSKAMVAMVKIGDQTAPLSGATVIHEGVSTSFDSFVRGIMRAEAEDAGVQQTLHQRVKRVVG